MTVCGNMASVMGLCSCFPVGGLEEFWGICVALSECVFILEEDFYIFYFVLCYSVYYFRRIIVM